MLDLNLLAAVLIASSIAFLYIVWPISLAIEWYLYGRDPQVLLAGRKPFQIPKAHDGRELTASETGTLVDERADNPDIVAALVDLARRGHLTIHEFDAGKFRLAKLHGGDELRDYEKYLLDGLFQDKDQISLLNSDFGSTARDFKDVLYSGLVTDGMFPQRPDRIRRFYVVMSGVAAFTFNFPLLLSSSIFGANMPRKTVYGAQQGSVARALKSDLMHKIPGNQTEFEKFLPYAVALGVSEAWTKDYHKHNLHKPSWFISSGEKIDIANITHALFRF